MEESLLSQSAKLNCLIVIPSLARAGAETQSVDLANGLASRGHSVHLCSFEPQLDLQPRISGDVHCHHQRRKSKLDKSLITWIAGIIDGEGVDVVLGVMQFATLIASLAAKRSGRSPAVVAGIHTTRNRGLKDELQDRLVYRRLLRRVPAVIFVCRNQRDHWIHKYSDLEDHSFVVHNGVAPENFQRDDFLDSASRMRAELGIPDDAFVFACLAAFRPEKGHSILIDAFSRLKGKPYLVLAGDGELRAKSEEMVSALGLVERTRFLGNIKDIPSLIVASNATVLASTAVETFSMAMLESMALGVPMIAPRIGGLPEAIVHTETGMLFSIGDTDALARCMQSVVENPRTALRMGEVAEQKVLGEFTLEKMVVGTESILREAVLTTRLHANENPDSSVS